MPDDGERMIKCKKCRKWYHSRCETSDFEAENWECQTCMKMKKVLISKIRDQTKDPQVNVSLSVRPFVRLFVRLFVCLKNLRPIFEFLGRIRVKMRT